MQPLPLGHTGCPLSLTATRKGKTKTRLRAARKAFPVLIPPCHLQLKWGWAREHQDRLKGRETAGQCGGVKWEIQDNVGKKKGGTIQEPKSCSVKGSEQGLTPSEISIETQGQRRRKAGQEMEQRPWFGVPELREEKQRVGYKKTDRAVLKEERQRQEC